MTTPSRRRCRLCGQLAAEADLTLMGRTESKPGWCGGPRQGGRPVFMHPACVEAEEARHAAYLADLSDRRVRATAAREAGDLVLAMAILDGDA